MQYIVSLPLSKFKTFIGRIHVPTWAIITLGILLFQTITLLLVSYHHAGDLGFPLDDGYIYSTYVRNLYKGYPFQYNAGEFSGGVTSLGWFFVISLAYFPFRILSPDTEMLIWVAYVSGFIFHYLTVLLAYLFAFHITKSRTVARLMTLLVLFDGYLLWGAFSGMEVSLAAFISLSIAFIFIRERQKGRFILTPFIAGLAPIARPELVVLPAAIGLIYILESLGWSQAILKYELNYSPRRELWKFGVRVIPMIVVVPCIYFIATGIPLPTSFYAKVHAITSVQLSKEHLSNHADMVVAGLSRILVILSGLACIGFLLARSHKNRRNANYLVLVLVGYATVKILGGPWLGQMQRYLSPLDPIALIGLGFLVSSFVKGDETWKKFSSKLSTVLPLVVVLCVIFLTIIFARNEFAVHVRNTKEAHVDVAKWLSLNTPEDAIIASEPIGAVGFMSERQTVDIYGLTTPEMLGHYQEWDYTWEYLREIGVDYLIFYPTWFPGGDPPAWLQPVKTVWIDDNKIVGDDVIVIYLIDWDLYG